MTHTQTQYSLMTESKIREKILKVIKKRKIQKDKENSYSPVHFLLETMGTRGQELKEKHQSKQNSFI